MTDLRADLAALLAKVERMTPGKWSTVTADGDDYIVSGVGADDIGRIDRPLDITGIVALRNASPAYLAALARIAEIVEIRRGMDDGLTLDEIRAVLAGAQGETK